MTSSLRSTTRHFAPRAPFLRLLVAAWLCLLPLFGAAHYALVPHGIGVYGDLHQGEGSSCQGGADTCGAASSAPAADQQLEWTGTGATAAPGSGHSCPLAWRGQVGPGVDAPELRPSGVPSEDVVRPPARHAGHVGVSILSFAPKTSPPVA